MQLPTELVVPDFFTLTPFPWSSINTNFTSENRESTEWMLSYGIFANHNKARVHASNAELLGAYAYPYTDAKGLRIVNDFLMILFAIDEITDSQDAKDARATRETFVKALIGKARDDNSPVTRFTQDYLKTISHAPAAVQKRFIQHCIGYIDATTNEAFLREKDEVLSIEEYIHHRRENGGIRACFDLIEIILGIELPAGVFEDSNFMRVYFAAVDMICWSNDVYSWPIEYARGIEGSNGVTVVMKAKNLSLTDAVDYVSKLYKEFSDTILECKGKIKSFGTKEDEDIRLYIYAMEQWDYGNLVWSFDMQRYFGPEHEEVKRTRVVKLKEYKSVV